MGAVLLWVAIAGLLFWEILALSRPRTISWDEYEKIKGRTQMLQPLLELQNIYSPGMRDLLKAKTEIHEVKEDDGDPPSPGADSAVQGPGARAKARRKVR